MNDDYPIIVGIAGKAGTGKTTIANMLSPKSQFSSNGESVDPELVADLQVPVFDSTLFWDHRFFAMPLYKLVSIRQGTEGNMQRDRILYQIHETLVQLFSGNPLYGAPPYHELVEMAYYIADADLPAEGKPRKFLQDVGSLCRSFDPDCFVKYAKKCIYQDFIEKRQAFEREQTMRALEDPDTPEKWFKYICIVSDVRMENEAKFIHNEPNGILIRFDASPEVREERLTRRDGQPPKKELDSHITEQLAFDDELIDYILDTDNLSPMDQALDTRSYIFKHLQD